MMLDSSSLVPAHVKTAPLPALKRGSSSNSETAWVATSRAVACGLSRSEEAEKITARRDLRYAAWAAGVRFAREILPAPPWMIIRGCIVDEFDDIAALE